MKERFNVYTDEITIERLNRSVNFYFVPCYPANEIVEDGEVGKLILPGIGSIHFFLNNKISQ